MSSVTQPSPPSSPQPPGQAHAPVSLRVQAPMFLVGLGHGATHWLLGTFLILLPYVTKELGLSYTEAGLMVTVLHIASLFGNLFGGMAVDISGRRVMFLVMCLAVGGAGMLGYGMSQTYGVMLLMVVLISFGNSFWHSPAISYISLRYSTRRGYALSMHSTGASLGDMLSPGVAGLLLTWISWRYVAASAMAPALLFAVIIFVMLLPGDSATQGEGGRGMSLGQWLGAAREMLFRRSMLAMGLMVAFRGMGQTGITVFLPLYLADVLQVGPALVGGTILGMHLGAVVMTPVAGHVSDRIGRRPVVMAGLVSTTLIVLGLTQISDTVLFVVVVFLLGFSLYSIRAVMQSWMIDISPPRMSGTATSMFFTMQHALSAPMPLIGGMLADSHGLFEVFYLIAGVMFAANLMILLVPRTTESGSV